MSSPFFSGHALRCPGSPAAIQILGSVQGAPCPRPLCLTAVSAGFPSPAEDYLDRELDLNEHLIQHPAATFFVRVCGQSMIQAGIHDQDILVVDRSLEARNRSVVVAVMQGEMTVKRLLLRNGRLWLTPENPDFQPLEVTTESDFEIWGVVTHVIHSLAGG